MLKRLLRQIDKVDVVSFDIFDTLLKRNVRHPKDVFNLVESKYNAESSVELKDFRSQRVLAECKARENATKEDITLDDIYTNLPYDQETSAKLKTIELEIESIVLKKNDLLKQAFDYAIDQKKNVVIVSDMYLPKDFLERILQREGYSTYNKLYVSNSEGLLKSTGNLFKLVMKEQKCSPRHMLHIGDSKRGDWLAPFKLGIKIFPIATHYKNTLYYDCPKDVPLSQNLVYSFLNNSVFADRYFQIGYETLGPLLFGFSEWLHEQKEQHNIEKLLFFSRDGEIMLKAYSILHPDENTQYVYVSRRSLLVPLFWSCKSWDEILNLIPMTRFTLLSAFFENVGLDINAYKESLHHFGFSGTEMIPLKDFSEKENLRGLLNSILDDVIQNSKKEFENFERYFNSLNIPSNYGIVDIGWKGTMQRSYERLLHLAGKKDLPHGYYIGLTSNLERGNAFLFSPSNNKNESKVWSFLGLFEMLFSASHGSVKCYTGDEKNPIKQYDFEFNFNDDTRSSYKKISLIQEGALQFIKDFHKSTLDSFVKWDSENAFNGLCNLGLNTRKEDLSEISLWKFYNTTLTPLADPKLSIKPGMMKKDFSNAAWKIAYLKKLLKLPLPYFKIYTTLRSKLK